MARDAGLRLAQDRGELGHRELGLAEQGQDTQPRGLAGGLEGAVQGLERQVGGMGIMWAASPIWFGAPAFAE